MAQTKSAHGATWFAKRQAQANAARKRPHKQHEFKRPGKRGRNALKREELK